MLKKAPYRVLKKACVDLSKIDGLKMIQTIGKTYDQLVVAFTESMDLAYDDDIELPDDTIALYNFFYAAEEEITEDIPVYVAPPVEQPKSGAKRYITKPAKTDGVVAHCCKMIKDDPDVSLPEMLDKLELIFPDKTRKQMYSTAGHVSCIGRAFLPLFGIEVGVKRKADRTKKT